MIKENSSKNSRFSSNMNNFGESLSQEDQLLLYNYYKKRKKIIAIVILIIIIFIFFIGAFLFNSNKEATLLELTTDKTVVIKQSKIDKFDAKKYIQYAKEKDTVIKIPDIKDTNKKPGKYQFEYSVYDKKTKETQKQYLKIVIKDDIKPVLKLSQNEVTINQNQEVDLLSYIEECTDNTDGDLKNEIKYNTIDISKVGEEKVIYSVKDKAKNTTKAKLIVKIIEPQPVESLEQNNTNENNEQNQSSQSTQNNQNNTTNSSNNSASTNKKENSSTTSSNTSTSKSHPELNGKQFLFTDGYDMSNVMSVCASELSKNNTSGSCVPIYDNGVIIGAKIVVN